MVERREIYRSSRLLAAETTSRRFRPPPFARDRSALSHPRSNNPGTGVYIYIYIYISRDERGKRKVRKGTRRAAAGGRVDEGAEQRKKEPRQYITPSAVRRGRPAKIAITPAESNEIKLHYLACHGAINHTPFNRQPSPSRASFCPPRRSRLRRPFAGSAVTRSFAIPVYTRART
jgi:hypothetical protein